MCCGDIHMCDTSRAAAMTFSNTPSIVTFPDASTSSPHKIAAVVNDGVSLAARSKSLQGPVNNMSVSACGAGADWGRRLTCAARPSRALSC